MSVYPFHWAVDEGSLVKIRETSGENHSGLVH